MNSALFSAQLIAWQKESGRHDLPWQKTRDPYCIWVSEIMLQQTQVSAVIPYYQRFLGRFPDLKTLAEASVDEVMAHWSGLGYYARARNMHKAAQSVMAQGLKQLPTHPDELVKLPGIGRSTAAAIAAFSSGHRAAILDGNVKRVLARYCAIPGFPGTKSVENTLWQIAESFLPENNIESYTQGLMDLGATVCVRSSPKCAMCPLQESCEAFRLGKIEHYPAPRPSKPRVERHARAWLIGREGGAGNSEDPNGQGEAEDSLVSNPQETAPQILLEQRPPSGIWGGLWCLPEQLSPEIEMHLITEAQSYSIEHSFTHFKLLLTVQKAKWIASKGNPALKIAEPGQSRLKWFTLDEALKEGLPAPIKKLLLHITQK